MEIYIVRHGETIWNKDRRFQGRTDIPLTMEGRRLAQITGAALEYTHFDKIFSSPLSRALDTAKLIRGCRNIDIETDDRLKELSFGLHEGDMYADLIKDDSLNFKYFFDAPELYIAKDEGETLESLISRAGDFMKDKIEPLADKYERVMIVAHGALNKAIMSYVKKHPISDFWSGGLQGNCNVIILDYDKGVYTIIDETKKFYD